MEIQINAIPNVFLNIPDFLGDFKITSVLLNTHPLVNELPSVTVLTQIPIQMPKYTLPINSEDKDYTKKLSAKPKLNISVPITMCAMARPLIAVGFIRVWTGGFKCQRVSVKI